MLHLETEAPDWRLVALDAWPLRWPVAGASAHRMGGTYGGENITMDVIPDLLRLESVDTLIHVGSHYDGVDSSQYLGEISQWVAACQTAGVRQLVYLSDCRVYGASPDTPMPVTERAALADGGAYRRLGDAEPKARIPLNITPSPEAMRVAVMRTAMTVGPTGSNPAAAEFFGRNIRVDGHRNPPVQFLHEYDLARSVTTAINHRLGGIYNVAGDGSVFWNEIATILRAAGVKPARPGTERNRQRRGAGLRTQSRNPIVVSTTKFKQAARFRYKYSSANAFRAYCHSVLLEPAGTR